MNFIAMDFETANANRTSACSLGITIIRDNKIKDTFQTLINPQQTFAWPNMKINHLHPEDVKNAPTFKQIWPLIQNFYTKDQLVVAHNATFDNDVLCQTLNHQQIRAPRFLSLDSLLVMKHLVPGLKNYRLNTICDRLGIDLKHHHQALDDATACARIILWAAQNFGETAMQPFVKTIN